MAKPPLRRLGIKPLIAKRNTEHGSGPGRYHYVVEAGFDWLFNQRRLRVRYEKRDDMHQAFLIVGCFLICWRRIIEFCWSALVFKRTVYTNFLQMLLRFQSLLSSFQRVRRMVWHSRHSI